MAEYKRKTKENPTTKSMKTVRSHIEERTFSNVYLLFGEETYLVNQYRDMLIHALVNDGDTMNFTTYNADSFNVNSADPSRITSFIFILVTFFKIIKIIIKIFIIIDTYCLYDFYI
jgi:DNA polymerase-3 subunit delta